MGSISFTLSVERNLIFWKSGNWAISIDRCQHQRKAGKKGHGIGCLHTDGAGGTTTGDLEVLRTRGTLCRGLVMLAPGSLSSNGQAQSNHRTGRPVSDTPAVVWELLISKAAAISWATCVPSGAGARKGHKGGSWAYQNRDCLEGRDRRCAHKEATFLKRSLGQYFQNWMQCVKEWVKEIHRDHECLRCPWTIFSKFVSGNVNMGQKTFVFIAHEYSQGN